MINRGGINKGSTEEGISKGSTEGISKGSTEKGINKGSTGGNQ